MWIACKVVRHRAGYKKERRKESRKQGRPDDGLRLSVSDGFQLRRYYHKYWQSQYCRQRSETPDESLYKQNEPFVEDVRALAANYP